MTDAPAQLLSLLKQMANARQMNRLEVLYGPDDGPYEWQKRFHNMGIDHPERAVIAANQVGKTYCGGAEVAIHLTGRYPKWWKGRRFDEPTYWIVSGQTNVLTRNVLQAELFGGMKEGERRPSGEGWVPAECIGEFTFRQCGIPNVFDQVRVQHVSGPCPRSRLCLCEQWSYAGVADRILEVLDD